MTGKLVWKCTFIYIGASTDDVGVTPVALCAVADVPRAIGRVDALAVVADAGIAGRLLRLGGAGHGCRAVVADGPVQHQRHGLGPRHAPKVGRPEGVQALLHDEGVVAGAEALVGVRPSPSIGEHVHEVVGEARRDVDVAAADAGTNTVLQDS